MAMLIDAIAKNWPKTNIGDIWYFSKPYIKPLRWRISDAWGVLTGRYGAHKYASEEIKRGNRV